MTDDKNVTNMSFAAIAVVAVAVVVLMGIAFIGQFSLQLRVITTADPVQFIVPATNASVVVGTTGQFPFLRTVTGCFNATNVSDTWAASNYNVNEGNADGGSVTNTGAVNIAQTVNCTISYRADSDAQASADNFNAGLAIFGTFMAVLVLALIGKIIIGLFRRTK